MAPTMSTRLRTKLVSLVAWTAFANAVPADPTITPPAMLPRQADAAFIGWLQYNSTWYSQQCDSGATWYQSGGYGQCCPDTVTSCPAPTACINGPNGGSQIYPLGSTTITTACTGNYNDTAYSICNTAVIYESFGDPNPLTDIICGDASVRWNYYRSIPASLTEVSSEAPSSSPSPQSSSSGPAPTQTSTPDNNDGGSKAWIAGAVIGPVVGIALIAGLVWFLMRRRKKNKTNLPQTGGAAMGPPPGVQPYTDAKPQMSPNPAYGQPSPGFNPNEPYNQQGFAQATPTPGYAQPYDAPGSPPPQGGAYANDAKYGHYQQPGHPEAAELGVASPTAGPSQTAELPSESAQR